ncbi:CPBP family intramembrane glutamic endopeptidase [Paenibacillus tuaregi]|uniref:CPBP family intramembrane glutamic endopeptidase n=1 Tax=Paenibacillus tuaregi TaxID=1816681 RepID=UPI000838F2FE|nr:CPBP family intramembrane glutamic endopeptidase [Paenibacillus tuaregi]
MVNKISGYKGLILLCLMSLLLNYLILYPLGLGQYDGPEHPYLFGIINLAAGLLELGLITLYLRRVERMPVRLVGLGWNRKHLIYSVTAVVMTLVLHLVYLKSLDEGGVLKAYFNVHYFENAQLVPMLLCTGAGWFVNAFYEELLRGYFAIKLKSLGPLPMFLITGVTAILMHAINGLDWIYAILIFIMNSTFLYVYLKSGSIYPAVAAHFIYNFTLGHLFGSGAVAFLIVEGELPLWYTLTPIALYVILILVTAKLIYGDASITHCLGNLGRGDVRSAHAQSSRRSKVM